MKRRRPLSYQIGDVVVRQDPDLRAWRVFFSSVEMFHGSRDACLEYVKATCGSDAMRTAWGVK